MFAVSELKKRWRGLRDTFARELRRLEAGGARSELELRAATGWRHFPQLLFLRRVVHIARTNKNKKQGGSSSRERSSSLESDRDPLTARRGVKCERRLDSEPESPPPSPGLVLDPPPEPRSARSPARSRPRSPARSRSPGSDGDSQFLLSLAPFLRSVARRRKLLVRARLTQVLIDEQNQTNTPTLQPQL